MCVCVRVCVCVCVCVLLSAQRANFVVSASAFASRRALVLFCVISASFRVTHCVCMCVCLCHSVSVTTWCAKDAIECCPEVSTRFDRLATQHQDSDTFTLRLADGSEPTLAPEAAAYVFVSHA